MPNWCIPEGVGLQLIRVSHPLSCQWSGFFKASDQLGFWIWKHFDLEIATRSVLQAADLESLELTGLMGGDSFSILG